MKLYSVRLKAKALKDGAKYRDRDKAGVYCPNLNRAIVFRAERLPEIIASLTEEEEIVLLKELHENR